MNNQINYLFQSIPYTTSKDIDNILLELDTNKNYIITQALLHAYNSGVFTLIESEIVSKIIRIINENGEQ